MQFDGLEGGAEGEALEPRKQLFQMPAGGALQGRNHSPRGGLPHPLPPGCWSLHCSAWKEVSIGNRLAAEAGHCTWFVIFWVNEEFQEEGTRSFQLVMENTSDSGERDAAL